MPQSRISLVEPLQVHYDVEFLVLDPIEDKDGARHERVAPGLVIVVNFRWLKHESHAQALLILPACLILYMQRALKWMMASLISWLL